MNRSLEDRSNPGWVNAFLCMETRGIRSVRYSAIPLKFCFAFFTHGVYKGGARGVSAKAADPPFLVADSLVAKVEIP